ncbi:hypothetical protein [Aliamphritea ceti]|uniref:hypothetical protein n=1 Tax=Aliamphritea ceti TaxID=1524258 RepID=UPI0021C48894|nr:hypothetical protein [Aliamphritea ceti]
MSKQHFQRFDENFAETNTGRQFIDSPGHVDLESMNILYSSVDTVRQLYKLRLKESIIDDLGLALEGIPGGKVVYTFGGYQWMLRRGGASGYQFSLQNAELGIVLLLKSRYAKLEASGTHLKIEVSPKMIFDNTPEDLQIVLNSYADMLSVDSLYSPAGVAIHLACDHQGWQPAKDFVSSITCRSRRVSDRSGISELTLDTDICTVYGAGQSYLFGSASTLQFALYNKSKEAHYSDKLDYFKGRWNTKTKDFLEPLYNPEETVWRAEIRFSHSVIHQFALANQTTINTYEDVIKHLGGLWTYGLNNFRYDYNSRFIHPVWTVLMTEAGFDQFETGFEYRREYKKPGVGNERNVTIALGNLLSVYARNKFPAHYALKCIKRSGLYLDLMGYFRSRGLDRSDLLKYIEESLIQRRLASKVA